MQIYSYFVYWKCIKIPFFEYCSTSNYVVTLQKIKSEEGENTRKQESQKKRRQRKVIYILLMV